MTLIITEVRQLGIFMAADSHETNSEWGNITGTTNVDKIIYFESMNLLIGTWGDSSVGEKDPTPVNLFLEEGIPEWFQDNDIKTGCEVLAAQLNSRYNYEISDISVDMGFHIAGFDNSIPRLYHVHFDNGRFVSNKEYREDSLPNNDICYQLRNGLYKSFAANSKALKELIEKYDSDLLNEIGTGEENTNTDLDRYKEIYSYQIATYILLAELALKKKGQTEIVGGDIKVHFINTCKNNYQKQIFSLAIETQRKP